MKFIVYRCPEDRDFFLVTDQEHMGIIAAALCPTAGGEPEMVGEFEEMGDDRVAFDEQIARNSIAHQGYYRFEAKSFAPVAEAPSAMPG